MLLSRAVPIGASLALALSVGAPPSSARDYTIRTSNGAVAAIGAFHPSRDPTVGAAIAVFGSPTSRKGDYGGDSCVMKWRSPKLTINFSNFGAPGAGACADTVGRAQSFVARDRRFRTWGGLRPRARSRTILDKHPTAEFQQGSWWLRSAYSPFGDGDEYPVVRALIHSYRVTALAGWIGGAGE